MNPKKRILIFIDWFYPGYKAGGPVRSVYHLIQKLQGDYSFYVVTRNTDYLEASEYPGIESNKWVEVFDSKVYYISSSFLNYRNLKKIASEVNADLHYINGIFSPYFSIRALRISKSLNKEVLIAPRGMLKQSALAIKPLKKKVYLEFAKRKGLFRNVTFHATNEEELNDIRQIFSSETDVRIAPNIPVEVLKEPNADVKKPNELKILFVGRIAPEKNLEYALNVLLELKYTSGISFRIIGSHYNQGYWNVCSKKIELLNQKGIDAKYLGTMDYGQLLKSYQENHLLFNPTQGENFGHSIFESLAVGTPVLISDQTPWRNLGEKKAGFDLALEQIDDMCNQIELFRLMDDNTFQQWRSGALNYAKSFEKDSKVMEANKKLFLTHVEAD